jgi:hypothetical protein
MKSLYNTIIDNDKIDGHIHLFDHQFVINDYKTLPDNDCVGFMDIDFEHLNKYDCQSVLQYYDNYINNYYTNNVTLLSTGIDVNTMIMTYDKYPNIIKGFGELKCYEKYTSASGKTISLPFGNLDWITPLCDFNKSLKLPIYIHWYVFNNDRKQELHNLLTQYPTIPFVLCHCGMSPFRDYVKQYELVTDLLLTHNNLYVDISYECIFFFNEHPEYLRPLFGRCLLGTDLNRKCIVNKNDDKYIDAFNSLYNINLNYKNTYNKLFK